MKITMDDPQLEKGTLVAILGNLAVVENGGSVEVTDEQLAMYTEQTGKTAEEAMENSAVLSTTDEKPADKRKRFEEEAKKAAEAEAESAGQTTAEVEAGTKKAANSKS